MRYARPERGVGGSCKYCHATADHIRRSLAIHPDARRSFLPELGFGTLLLVYFSSLACALALAFGTAYLTDYDLFRLLFFYSGVFFLVAASTRPWWWFETLRQIRWFRLVQPDVAMQVILLALGLGLIATAVLEPDSAFTPR
jgi:hypothetical protein